MEQPRKKISLTMAFKVAMTDAIDQYVREVLKARGLILQEAFDVHASEECLQAKDAIVRELGEWWAAFEGYEREPPGEPRPAEPVAAADPAPVTRSPVARGVVSLLPAPRRGSSSESASGGAASADGELVARFLHAIAMAEKLAQSEAQQRVLLSAARKWQARSDNSSQPR